jgi:hypothetical protein
MGLATSGEGRLLGDLLGDLGPLAQRDLE